MASRLGPYPAQTLARQLADYGRNLKATIHGCVADSAGVSWLRRASVEINRRLDGDSAVANRPSEYLTPPADTAAQLLTYGAFLDRCELLPRDLAGSDLVHGDLAGHSTSFEFDALGIAHGESIAHRLNSLPGMPDSVRRLADEVLRTLDSIDIHKVLADLQTRALPVCAEAHFYEHFLAQYAQRQRRQQGVYYTPAPVVRFIVRSVNRLLRDAFQVGQGLADPAASVSGRRLRVIDPACGSGTFLLAVLQQATRSDGAPSHADPRQPVDWTRTLHGFDVQPVACLVARQLLERKVLERKVLEGRWPENQRPTSQPLAVPGGTPWWSVRCVNALEQTSLFDSTNVGPNGASYLPVILGNPPYSNFGRRNRLPWIRDLLADYKAGLDEKKLNLDDDFIKFIRWAQHHVDLAGAGIVAFVTSNTYLAGLTHRGMRQSLRRSFDQLYVFDLHGDRKRDVRNGGASLDENVFDIQQGVAVGVFVKTGREAGSGSVFHGGLTGTRLTKLTALDRGDVVSACSRELEFREANSFFVPKRPEMDDAYSRFPSLDEVFQHYVSGVQTKQDAVLTDLCRSRLAARIRDRLACGSAAPSVEPADHQRRAMSGKKSRAEPIEFDAARLRPYQVAPFDFRWLYYEPCLLGRPRWSVARHLLRPNLALVFMRQSTNPGDYDHFLATTTLVSDRVFYSAHGAPFFAPLFLDGGSQIGSNLQPAFVREVSRLWRLPFEISAHGELQRAFGARDVFDYAYAVFHSPDYRTHYRERLVIGFPRLPLTANLDLVRELCTAGRRLVELDTTLPDHRDAQSSRWRIGTDRCVRRGYPTFVTQAQSVTEPLAGRIDINDQTGLEGVDAADWEFQVGGYAVIQKWLKARRGTRLNSSQRDYVQHLVQISKCRREWVTRIQEMLSPWPWA